MYDRINLLRYDIDVAKKYFLTKLAYNLSPIELKNLMEKNAVIVVDVRKQADFEISHISDAISIPIDVLAENLNKLNKNHTTVVYSYNQHCNLATRACLILADYGYPSMILEGGFRTWKEDFLFSVT